MFSKKQNQSLHKYWIHRGLFSHVVLQKVQHLSTTSVSFKADDANYTNQELVSDKYDDEIPPDFFSEVKSEYFFSKGNTNKAFSKTYCRDTIVAIRILKTGIRNIHSKYRFCQYIY